MDTEMSFLALPAEPAPEPARHRGWCLRAVLVAACALCGAAGWAAHAAAPVSAHFLQPITAPGVATGSSTAIGLPSMPRPAIVPPFVGGPPIVPAPAQPRAAGPLPTPSAPVGLMRLGPMAAAGAGAGAAAAVAFVVGRRRGRHPRPGGAPGLCATLADSDAGPAPEASTLELVRFIIPTLAGWLSSEIMSVVDTAIVGTSSANELAALGPATMLTDSSAYLFFWLNIATTSLFARSLAAGRPDAAYDVLSDALWCGLFCGAAVALVLATSGGAALVAICRNAPSVVPAAASYLHLRLLGLPFFMSGTVLQAACIGAKDSTSPLLVLLASALLNLGLDAYLVIGLGWGIAGAAIATVAAQVLQTALLAAIVLRKRTALGARRSLLLLRGLPSPRRTLSFVTYAGPMAFVLFGKIMCYNAMTLAATCGGVAALAAHQVMVSIFFLGCKFGDTVSQTAQAYLPACYAPADREGAPAARDPPPAARRLSMRLLRLSTGLGAFVSLLAYSTVTLAPGLFTADAAVIAQMLGVAPLLLAALSMHASTMCSEGLLIGTQQFGFLAGAYGVNIAVFLTVLYAVARQGLGLPAVWTALLGFQVVRLCAFVGQGWQSKLLRRGA